jgi:hypothetical protein
MTSSPKRIVLILLLLSAVYFVIFYFPNAAASRDVKMVMAFEPDEGVPLGYVFAMIQPAESVKQALINFAFYDYYFYGYPYFAYSALMLLPVQLAGQIDNYPLVMATLRQMVSVLPILLSILLLVYLQTRFQSYRAIVLFIFLASIPAVIRNNFWWHPDGLSILLAMLAIFFLARDDLRFGRNFYLAALMMGFSAGTKGIGFFFFLTIIVYLLWGVLGKKITFRRMAFSAVGFIGVLAAGYLIANPILIYPSIRRRYFTVFLNQSGFLAAGYEIYVEKGPAAAYRMSQQYFGHWLFMLAMFATCVWGIVRDQARRLLYTIILTWTVPITLLAMSLIHFKFQYWLPVMLPLFSCAVILLPDRLPKQALLKPFDRKLWGTIGFKAALGIIALLQFVAFVRLDVQWYDQRLNRERNAVSIAFFDKALAALEPLPTDDLYVYHETRMYVPPTLDWRTESLLEVLNYPYVHGHNFDVLLIMQQRVADYLNTGIVGIDAERFALGQDFYTDVRAGAVDGYEIVYKNRYGLVLVRADLYDRYYAGQEIGE